LHNHIYEFYTRCTVDLNGILWLVKLRALGITPASFLLIKILSIENFSLKLWF